MRHLAVRSRQDEQMDAPDLDPAVYAKVLHDLARVNRWTFTARSVLAYLKRAVGDARRFRLMDVGFGDGDILRAIARWARRRGIQAESTEKRSGSSPRPPNDGAWTSRSSDDPPNR